MDIPSRIAVEKAVGIAIGLMAIELLGRITFNLSLTAAIIGLVMP